MSNPFSELKHNLYEILNISQNASMQEIKKAYAHMIKNFHPDKSNVLDMELFHHITACKNILLDPVVREEYNNFLTQPKDLIHSDLKTQFKKDNVKPKKIEQQNFNSKMEELNKLHGYSNFIENKVNSMKYNPNVNIEKRNFKNTNEFNSSFEASKDTNSEEQLIIWKEEPSSIVPYSEATCASLDNFEKLYVEDNVEDINFTSLNRAFLLHPNKQDKPIDMRNLSELMDERMKVYKASLSKKS